MRILAIADVEDDLLIARLEHAERGRYDLVVSCGDLSAGYLDCVATLANAPLAYVRGNHDVRYEDDPHLGGTNLDGRIEEFGGLRFAGLEGSLDYREGIVGYNQAQMRRRVVALGLRAALTGGIDVLVTHAPARGHGDLPDPPHQGFDAFNGLLDWVHPRLMLHGHVHLNYGVIERERTHPSGTRLVNAYGWHEVEL
ncbi:MAG: metallophosphoesterase family protein [Atopobiaceae bacterium]|nr:metallophosphoesterase family protein [Atopobiaceae bacterium]